MLSKGLAVGIIVLFIASAVIPMTLGYNIRNTHNTSVAERYSFDRYLYPEYYNYYNASEIPNHITTNTVEESTYCNYIESVTVGNTLQPSQPLDGPMDSPWPMYCHDIRHTGRSPYSTAGNSFYNKWWVKSDDYIEGSGVIDHEGVIYFSSVEGYNIYFYAVFPNGILKWKCKIDWLVSASPAIAEDGTIYVGDRNYAWGKLYSISPNGTINWKLYTYGEIYSSPTIGPDGTIYVGDGYYNINAINPNGTFKWRYKTGLVVYSSPAIGDDGTVYCGSHDTYLYAFYPNNGTLKWKYKTGDCIRVSPCIGDDGTIYVVSLDNYLHAVNPNGTLKWMTYVGAGTSPTIGQDGTIYAGYRTLYAVNPNDGSVKWTFDVGGTMRGGTPCNSIDGTIFVGTSDGGELIAINPDGTERWRTHIGTCEFAPIMGEDGTIYVGNSIMEEVHQGGFVNVGYLYAFNNMDPNAPTVPEINGPIKGKKDIEYQYKFKSTSPLGRDLYYYIEWGDGDWTTEWWIGPYSSGEEVILNHTWPGEEVYKIRARCKDTENLWGPFGELTVSTPFDLQISQSNNLQISQHSSNQFLLKMIQRLLPNMR